MDDSTYKNIKAITIRNITTPNILFFFNLMLDFLRIIELMLPLRHKFSSSHPLSITEFLRFMLWFSVCLVFGGFVLFWFLLLNAWWSHVDYRTSQNLRTFSLLWCFWQVTCSRNMELSTPSAPDLSCGYRHKASTVM